jgi:hypothetical protein
MTHGLQTGIVDWLQSKCSSHAFAGSTSHLPSECPSAKNESILLSTTFHFTAYLGAPPPDALLVTPDCTVFVVHYDWLSSQSLNLFGGFLPSTADSLAEGPLIVSLPERSDVLSVVLHVFYGLPTFSCLPTFECLAASVKALSKYGLMQPLQFYVAPNCALYNALLNHAAHRPLEVYALAASHGFEDLASASSAHTLHLTLHLTAPETVKSIGTLYMFRLHKLHKTRMQALRDLLDIMPTLPPHQDSASNADNHSVIISKAYELAASQIWFSATPGESFSHVV